MNDWRKKKTGSKKSMSNKKANKSGSIYSKMGYLLKAFLTWTTTGIGRPVETRM